MDRSRRERRSAGFYGSGFAGPRTGSDAAVHVDGEARSAAGGRKPPVEVFEQRTPEAQAKGHRRRAARPPRPSRPVLTIMQSKYPTIAKFSCLSFVK